MNRLPEIDISVGERVRELREEAGVSLSALADQTGISKGYLWSLEKGETKSRPSGDTLYAIAAALGTSMSYLLGREVLTERSPEISESLRAFGKEEGLSKADLNMLASINFRGQQPPDSDSWGLVWQAIKHASVKR